MKRCTFIAGFTALACVVGLLTDGTALAHDEHAGHDAHGGVGKVVFVNSCAPAVQADFARGVAMLHSFWWSAGEQTFREVLAKDPSCGIAAWGIASLLMSNPLGGIGASPKDLPTAQAAIDQGRHIGVKTQRESDYIEAVAAYYQDFSNRSERARQEARSKAYEALAARYPDDDEAQIFSALYIAGLQAQSDQTYASYLKAAAILERQFAKYPEHPGVAHYLIHSYDAPPIAAKGLDSARRYAGLAPEAPHALHMPSHIFTRVGAWEDSVTANLRSYRVAISGGEPESAYHAADYAVYGDMQLARDNAARRIMDDAMNVKGSNPASPTSPYAIAAMAARYAMERGDWASAARLEPAGGKFAFTESITIFARALGAARSGDVASAEQDAARLAGLRKTLTDAKNTYWATEVEIQQIAAEAWIALAQKKPDEALKSMRAAADIEDKNEKHIVTPGRILPARELLGDMLLEAGQPAAALREYEASQKREPNRFRGYYGAARAAEAAGDFGKAKEYYGKLLALAKDADSPRAELTQAKAYVSR
jgi:tetratricopeptide (TPR) repeat protein